MKLIRFGLLAAALACASPESARADKALDTVFAEGQLSNVSVGQTLFYDYTRLSPDETRRPGIDDGEISVAIKPPAEGMKFPSAVLTMDDGMRVRELNPFPVGAGNPVLLVFLESVAGAVTRIAGGSPFYIKNRIKDSFRKGGALQDVEQTALGETLEAQEVVYKPFEGDKNEDKLGVFAGLELAFTVSKAAPGRILALTARAGEEGEGGFRERIVLERLETLE